VDAIERDRARSPRNRVGDEGRTVLVLPAQGDEQRPRPRGTRVVDDRRDLAPERAVGTYFVERRSQRL
jgi:hypothetical protein